MPRHGAGGVPGGQAEQGKGWVMLLLGWSLLQEPKLQPLQPLLPAAVPVLQLYLHPPLPSSGGNGSLSSFVGKRSSFGYSPPLAVSPYVCHL